MAVPWVALSSTVIILGTVIVVANKRSSNPIGRRGGGSWGYSIDYEKEIKQDEAYVALYSSERMRAISASLTDEELKTIQTRRYDAVDWALRYPDKREARAAILGIPLEDIVCAADTSDSLPSDLAAGDPPVGWMRRGNAVYKQLELEHLTEILPETLRKKLLSKAKTDLSRHKRNREKNGY